MVKSNKKKPKINTLNKDKLRIFIMALGLEDKLFIVTIIVLVLWAYSANTNPNASFTDALKSLLFLIIGAFLTRYTKTEGKKK